jgi:hypothetical protein
MQVSVIPEDRRVSGVASLVLDRHNRSPADSPATRRSDRRSTDIGVAIQVNRRFAVNLVEMKTELRV